MSFRVLHDRRLWIMIAAFVGVIAFALVIFRTGMISNEQAGDPAILKKGVYDLDKPITLLPSNFGEEPEYWGRYFRLLNDSNIRIEFIAEGYADVDIFLNGPTTFDRLMPITRIENNATYILWDLKAGDVIEPRIWEGTSNVKEIRISYYIGEVPGGILTLIYKSGETILIASMAIIGLSLIGLTLYSKKNSHNARMLLFPFTTRLFIILIAFIGSQFINYANSAQPLTNRSLPRVFFNWDVGFYVNIAASGYPMTSWFWAFPPLYSIILGTPLKLLNYVFGTSSYVTNSVFDVLSSTGLVLSTVFFLLSCVMLYKLGSLFYDQEVARKSLIFYSVFPTSLFLSGVYPISLYMLLILSAFYFAEKGKYVLAASLAFLSSLTMTFGFLLSLAFIAKGILDRKKLLNFLWLAYATILGTAIFLLYESRITGSILTTFLVERVWGTITMIDCLRTPSELLLGKNAFYVLPIILLAFGTFYLALKSNRKMLPYTLFTCILTLFFMFSANIISFTRLALLFFPVFWALAAFTVRRQTMLVAVACLFCSLLSLFTIMFTNLYPLF